MDLQTRKIEFVQEFLKLDDEETIAILEIVMRQQFSHNEDTFKPMTIAELNTRIDRSEDDFRNGRYKTSAELLAKYK
ncbi:hypothetical protein OGH69_15440 [Flavobacterium sp. MFBS3-15]|uniref:hypothetical protein n=1 Tax=Flavobacterium sp. MFBS3-15 TaxID=2989816 RepID=UPI002235B760|nr:hypothetical protein [Flavobacterium sp. MFBS3-15]MCW4470367.1 hypothetical protein [Flavobacterium sp. MFBS3-15]